MIQGARWQIVGPDGVPLPWTQALSAVSAWKRFADTRPDWHVYRKVAQAQGYRAREVGR